MGKYMMSNLGDIYMREKRLHAVRDELELKYFSGASIDDDLFLQGKMDALFEYRWASHRAAIKNHIVMSNEVKRAKRTGEADDDLSYMEGTLAGLQLILDVDRDVFVTNYSAVIYVCCATDELANIYQASFDSLSEPDKIGGYDSSERKRFFVSSNPSEIVERVGKDEDIDVKIICVIQNDGHTFSLPEIGGEMVHYLFVKHSPVILPEKLIKQMFASISLG